ncbi:hypothetical protein H6G00_05045 [Leptolyngbya sp. FACHB-541]|uniref:hypothetical protein n=1 Tax=Leptolyngbya sp. FACHB-541 TaxID=2692810 RepID=UPI0016898184|nr:hypothetical protein [Leptolyngbya sp. FACHB-541]MBD1995982.1 hypothetical protein [Leptolyngbya sp. FACHB-541]
MSLLDKIRKEAQEPTVKVSSRPDPLTQPLSEMPNLTVEADQQQEAVIAPKPASPPPTLENQLAAWEAELATYPTIADKKVGVRLETEILEEIETFCRSNKITPETLFEAFYVTCKDKDGTMRQVLKEARSRVERRTKVGNIKSLMTKTKNLLGLK